MFSRILIISSAIFIISTQVHAEDGARGQEETTSMFLSLPIPDYFRNWWSPGGSAPNPGKESHPHYPNLEPAALFTYGITTEVNYALKLSGWEPGFARRGSENRAEAGSIESFLVNTRYHFGMDSGLVPYVGAGFGVTRIAIRSQITGGVVDEQNPLRRTSVAAQALFGATTHLNSHTTLGLNYRYQLNLNPAYSQFTQNRGAHKFMIALDYMY